MHLRIQVISENDVMQVIVERVHMHCSNLTVKTYINGVGSSSSKYSNFQQFPNPSVLVWGSMSFK